MSVVRVVDFGSWTCKFGNATPGATHPAAELSSAITRSSSKSGGTGRVTKRSPVHAGSVVDWEALDELWEKADITGCQVLVCEWRDRKREACAAAALGKFGANGIAFVDKLALALLGSGDRRTGVVLKSGHTETICSAFYEGLEVGHAVQRTQDVCGALINNRLSGFLGLDEAALSTPQRLHIIKKTCLYVPAPGIVPPDPRCTLGNSSDVIVVPEPGRSLPSLLFEGPDAFDALVARCVYACDMDMREELLSNVVLCGGNTLFPGVVETLHSRLTSMFPHPATLHAPMSRGYSSWLGGCVAVHKCFGVPWLTHDAFDDVNTIGGRLFDDEQFVSLPSLVSPKVSPAKPIKRSAPKVVVSVEPPPSCCTVPECRCAVFVAHAFKPNQCMSCSHDHRGSLLSVSVTSRRSAGSESASDVTTESDPCSSPGCTCSLFVRHAFVQDAPCQSCFHNHSSRRRIEAFSVPSLQPGGSKGRRLSLTSPSQPVLHTARLPSRSEAFDAPIIAVSQSCHTAACMCAQFQPHAFKSTPVCMSCGHDHAGPLLPPSTPEKLTLESLRQRRSSVSLVSPLNSATAADAKRRSSLTPGAAPTHPYPRS